MSKKKGTSKKTKSGGKDKKTPTATHRQGNPQRRPGITMERWELLLAAYNKHRTVRAAAREIKMGDKTAQKYIEVGYPDHGMPPIKGEVAKIDAKAAEMGRMTLAKHRVRYLEQVDMAMGTSELEFKLHRVWTQQKVIQVQQQEFEVEYENGKPKFDENGNPVLRKDQRGNLIPKMVRPSLDFAQQVRSYDTLARLGERALGAADETIGDAAQENVTANLTREEKIEYMNTGKLPDRMNK